jgi:hypothetical protein
MRHSSHIPEPLRRPPRGGGIFNLIALIATAILTGGIGLGILAIIDASSCLVNVFWGCSGGTTGVSAPGGTLCASPTNSCGQSNVGYLQTTYTCPSGYTLTNGTQCYQGGCLIGKGGGVVYGKGGGGPLTGKSGGTCTVINATEVDTCGAPTPPNSSCPTTCTSAPNACGQTNSGTISGGVCSASTPSNSSCPAPTVNNPGFYAQPSVLPGSSPTGGAPNSGTTLFWDTTNTTDCTITGDNGFSFSSTQSKGSVGTGTLLQTTTFTLLCEDGVGGPTITRSLKVLVDPHYKEI